MRKGNGCRHQQSGKAISFENHGNVLDSSGPRHLTRLMLIEAEPEASHVAGEKVCQYGVEW